ncbi:unnamed protein product [Urochloa decumbens]|uniref:F-box domain-containing protein n=1 Tax=Urochloa decumbens TaxID=240449 RepID=A0ABC8XER3_9POAL
MLLRTGKRLNRAPPGGGHNDDGLPLADEILLLIFAGLLDTDDLARCAATCRRWRRLVSSEASFICRSHPSRFVPAGFFHQGEEYGVRAVPRFVPLSPHTPRTAAAANALFAGEPFVSSRLVTARKGRLVLELCGGGSRLRLAVCDPVAGDVGVLPALAGRDRPGRYACTLLAAGDDDDLADMSSFRVVIVYDRRGFTACRTYSSDTGSWGPEGEVSGARVSGRSLAQAHAAAVVAGGAVFWRVRDAVLGLRLDGTPAEATLEPLPEDWATTRRDGGEGCAGGLLAVWPADGRLCLCVVEAGMTRTRYDSCRWEYDVEVQVLFREHGDGGGSGGEDDGEKWDALHARSATVRLQAPSGSYGRMTRVCLRGLCEKSGVVFLAAGFASHDPHWEALYAVDLVKMDAQLVDGVPDLGSGASFHGYEMDRVEYLTALGKRRGKGKMTIDDAEDIYDFC